MENNPLLRPTVRGRNRQPSPLVEMQECHPAELEKSLSHFREGLFGLILLFIVLIQYFFDTFFN